MIKLVTVIGARPQFIKASVVSKAFSKDDAIHEVIVHTGQHYDPNMSEIFFDQMGIPTPDYNLQINGGEHGDMTGRMLGAIEKILLDESPDFVLVYGDTNSTLAGALAAKKQRIKVIHVEAGLRSFNNDMPEEINRILTDRISDILFYPTEAAFRNLKAEGFPYAHTRLVSCGDVMYDAARFFTSESDQISDILVRQNLADRPFLLCTLHRSENTDTPENLRSIVRALNQTHARIPVVLPLHPRTQKKLAEYGIDLKVQTIPPVSYFDMLQLLQQCTFVMTDSGGLQKEAYFFEKLCLTLREQTEWVELVDQGYNVLCGSSEAEILACVARFEAASPTFEQGIYGDGKAAQAIRETILNFSKS